MAHQLGEDEAPAVPPGTTVLATEPIAAVPVPAGGIHAPLAAAHVGTAPPAPAGHAAAAAGAGQGAARAALVATAVMMRVGETGDKFVQLVAESWNPDMINRELLDSVQASGQLVLGLNGVDPTKCMVRALYTVGGRTDPADTDLPTPAELSGGRKYKGGITLGSLPVMNNGAIWIQVTPPSMRAGSSAASGASSVPVPATERACNARL